jgi:hypothetical protein
MTSRGGSPQPSVYRNAIQQISHGTAKGVQKGFEALDKMGWVIGGSTKTLP